MVSHSLRHGLLAFFSLLIVALPAGAQQNWRWVNPLPAAVGWKDVAFGNGVYVAVGGGGNFATSPDGITWTARHTGTTQTTLNGIEFANGLFVAVGMGNSTALGAAMILTSTDGLNWTANPTVASRFNAQLTDVAFGGGTWVVTGFGGVRLLSSTDGQTWTSRATPTATGIPSKVAYGAGRFVACSSNNNAYASTDGVTWSTVSVAPANSFIEAVAFGAGKFALVGRDSNFNAIAYTSTDGTTWTPANAITGASSGIGFTAVGGNASGFVAAGGSILYSSPDGVSWTARTSALPLAPRQLDNNREGVNGGTFAGSQFFVLGIYGSITSSPDGVTWTRRSSGTVADLGDVIREGSRFIAAGSGGTILTSPDGTAWTQVTTGSTADFNKLAVGNNRYVAVGYNGIYQSANLTSWASVPGTTFDRWTEVAFGGGRFVAANSATTLGVRTSTDGVTWSANISIPGAGGNTNDLVYGNNLFVLTMVGVGTTPSKIYTSADGTGWTQRASDLLSTTTQIFSIAFGGGRFVALTGNQRSLTSTDGITWTSNQLPTVMNLTRVRFLEGRFYASSVAADLLTYVSSDGVSWSAIPDSSGPGTLGSMNSLNGSPHFASSGTTVVAVGWTGMILRGELPAASAAGRLINLSVRTSAGSDDDTLIVGLAIGGARTAGNKAVLLRAVGPTLGAFGVGGALADPIMTVFQGQAQVAQNDDWNATAGAVFAGVGAFAFTANSRDAAIYNSALPSNSYSIQITGKNNGTGIALAEVYDATDAAGFTAATPRLVNVSARTRVGTGDNILIAGFVVGGQSAVRVLIRAVGPTLTEFGVGGALADPKLEIYRGDAKTAENDNWDAATAANFASVGAFNFRAGSRDAALVATLQPGNYTAQVSGVNNTTGIALVEVYELP